MNGQEATSSHTQKANAFRRFSRARAFAEQVRVCPRFLFVWAEEGKLAREKINARVILFDESEVLH